MPRLKHFDNENTARFITFSCYRRQPNLNPKLAKNIIIEQIAVARTKYQFKLLGYVIMPEHVHLVIFPKPETKMGYLIGEIKSFTARLYFASVQTDLPSSKRVFWEKRCYDHNCRSPLTVEEKINYCHNNPVKRGLVESPENWPWSSLNWYMGKRDVPLIIDELEM